MLVKIDTSLCDIHFNILERNIFHRAHVKTLPAVHFHHILIDYKLFNTVVTLAAVLFLILMSATVSGLRHLFLLFICNQWIATNVIACVDCRDL